MSLSSEPRRLGSAASRDVAAPQPPPLLQATPVTGALAAWTQAASAGGPSQTVGLSGREKGSLGRRTRLGVGRWAVSEVRTKLAAQPSHRSPRPPVWLLAPASALSHPGDQGLCSRPAALSALPSGPAAAVAPPPGCPIRILSPSLHPSPPPAGPVAVPAASLGMAALQGRGRSGRGRSGRGEGVSRCSQLPAPSP